MRVLLIAALVVPEVSVPLEYMAAALVVEYKQLLDLLFLLARWVVTRFGAALVVAAGGMQLLAVLARGALLWLVARGAQPLFLLPLLGQMALYRAAGAAGLVEEQLQAMAAPAVTANAL